MSFYPDSTPESVKAEILQNYRGELDTRDGSFMDLLVSPIAFEIFRNRMDREGIMEIIFPDKNSGIYIDMDGERYNITRKPGAYAEAEITIRGADGAVIPAGTAWLAADGREYRLAEPVTLTGGEGRGVLRAVDVGAVYNGKAGEINQVYTALPAVTSYTVGAATGGEDPESSEDLLARINAFRAHPSSSGNKWDYYNWALSVPGVGDAYVTPLWAGPGTVNVAVASPSGGKVDGDVVQAVREYIETQRPVGASVTVESVTEQAVAVSATVRLLEGAVLRDVRAAFEADLREYLAGIGLAGGTVSYNKAAYILLNVSGVEDFVTLTLDGGTEPVPVPASCAAVPGDIHIEEAGR